MKCLPPILLLAAGALSLGASEIAPAPAGEVRYLAGFDAESHTGLFQQVDADGKLVVLDRRQDWTLQEVHPVPLGSTQGVLLIWKDFPAQTKTSPELWADGEEIPGFEELSTLNRVWPAGDNPIHWTDARHEIQVRKGIAKLQVLRGLSGENEAIPLLRKREVYQLGASGAALVKARYQSVRTPTQRLNKIADLVEVQAWASLTAEMKKLDHGVAREYLHRAAIVMTRAPVGRERWITNKGLLDALVMSGGPASERAAARLFEMVQQEWQVGAE